MSTPGKSERSAHRAAIEKLMEQAWSLEPRDRVPVLEEAIRIADAHQDDEMSYDLRMQLVEAGTFGGREDRALVAFAWCLAYRDRTEPNWDDWSLLWSYKWIVAGLPDFPHVTREQIHSTLDDMERRFKAAGHGLKAVYNLRAMTAREMGYPREANRFARLDRLSKDDALADCEACQMDDDVYVLIHKKKPREALAAAKPIIEGRYSCETVPQRTYARLLLPLVKLGDLDTAYDLHRREYNATVRNPDLVSCIAEHIDFMALIGNLKTAVRLFESKLPWALDNPSYTCRFEFFNSGRLLMERLQADGKETIRLKLPAGVAGDKEVSRSFTMKELIELFEKKAAEIAAIFDARNGTSKYKKLLKEHKALKRHFTTYSPLAKS